MLFQSSTCADQGLVAGSAWIAESACSPRDTTRARGGEDDAHPRYRATRPLTHHLNNEAYLQLFCHAKHLQSSVAENFSTAFPVILLIKNNIYVRRAQEKYLHLNLFIACVYLIILFTNFFTAYARKDCYMKLEFFVHRIASPTLTITDIKKRMEDISC